MPRTKEFVPEQVLDAAIEVFRSHGYEATSIQELVDSTGLNRGSLYDTFGDKHSLFLAALDRYEKQRIERLTGILNAPCSPKAAIRRAFEDIIERASQPNDAGCLLVNTTVERASLDPECRWRAERNFTSTETAYYNALCRARDAGEIAPDRDLQGLARYLVSSARGLRVTAKAVKDVPVLNDIRDTILSILD